MTDKEVVKELRKEIDKILQTGKSLRSYRIYQYLDMLEQPQTTLSECIKEWEERGWKTSYICDGINLSKLNDGIEEYFYFDKDLKRIDCNCFISFDLIPLIHKTLKALEEMKDE